MNKYDLNVISNFPGSEGKQFRKYNFSYPNEEIIGVYGDEGFKLTFTNNTPDKIYAKFSIDGIDVLSGKEANTKNCSCCEKMVEISGDNCFVINSWSDNQEFRFVNTETSVPCVYTKEWRYPDRGIIAAAVFADHSEKNERVLIHTKYIRYMWANIVDGRIRVKNPYYPGFPGDLKKFNRFEE